MKKFLIHIGLIFIIFILYFLQANFFNWFTIAGVMPNLFIIFILWIGLFGNRSMGILYGILIGFLIDCLFRSQVGMSACTYGLIGFLATVFDKNFSKDSRMTMMFMVGSATILVEIILYFLNYIIFSTSLEMLQFIKILVIELIYNILITIIIYPLIQKCGYFIENECKGSHILTRYF